MLDYIIIASFVLIFVGLFFASGKIMAVFESNFAKLGQNLTEIVTKNDLETPSEHVSRSEFEQLKRDFASVEADVLRNLKKISTRERRARIYEQGDDPDEEPEEEEVDPALLQAGLDAINGTATPIQNAQTPPNQLSYEQVMANIRAKGR